MKVIMAEVVLENIGSTPHVYYASDFTLYDTSDNSYFGDDEDSSGGDTCGGDTTGAARRPGRPTGRGRSRRRFFIRAQ